MYPVEHIKKVLFVHPYKGYTGKKGKKETLLRARVGTATMDTLFCL